jgi:hypothetical protein
MTNHVIRLVLAFALLAGVTRDAVAQEQPVDFVKLGVQTRAGDTVFVTDIAGRQTTLKLGNVPFEQLIRQTGLSDADVKEIAVERADSPWNGALIGLALAGTPWLIVCAANDWCYYNEYGAENLLRTTALVTAGIGAGIGALLDLSMRQRMTLYSASSGRSLTINVSPAQGSGGLVRISTSF